MNKQSILGADLITPEEVAKSRMIVYTDKQITALAETLPSEEVLRWCAENGYGMMPTPPAPMSVLDVRALLSRHFFKKTGDWYDDKKFAQEEKTGSGWLAVRKTPVPNSTSKSWGEQGKLLSDKERVPSATEISWFITTYFEVRGVRLFEDTYVWTSSSVSDGGRVDVGRFDTRGFVVYFCTENKPHSSIGLAATMR